MKRLQVGDVFIAPEFDKLTLSYDGTRLTVNGSPEIVRNGETVDLRAFDPTRSTAKFVVTRAYLGGGGYGHGPGDYFPDGWQVIAHRLNPDGSYNEAGEEVGFAQDGCFINVVKKFTVVGKLKPTFV